MISICRRNNQIHVFYALSGPLFLWSWSQRRVIVPFWSMQIPISSSETGVSCIHISMLSREFRRVWVLRAKNGICPMWLWQIRFSNPRRGFCLIMTLAGRYLTLRSAMVVYFSPLCRFWILPFPCAAPRPSFVPLLFHPELLSQ